MIDVKKYINDPCNSLSMPYWKAKKTSVRSDTMIVHDSKYDEVLYRDWHDTKYYRMKHDLYHLTSKKIHDNFLFATVDEDSILDVVNVINQSNKEYEITKNDVNHWMREESYCKDLWILVYYKKIFHFNKESKIVYDEYGKKQKKDKVYLPVGLIISNFDNSTKEASIEQLHVIPSYRKFGLVESLIKESLLRISCIADFVTFSDKIDAENDYNQEFKNAGFKDEAIWHVLKKNN